MKIFEKLILTTLLANFFIASLGSPVSSKSNNESEEKSAIKIGGKDPEVLQLESLKKQVVDEDEAINTGDRKVGADASSISTFRESPNENNDNSNQRITGKESLSNLNKGKNKKSDMHQQLENMRHVTPEELALYIARTGDEDGVSLIIQEMISEHVMTTDDAVDFLGKIRDNLHYLKEQSIQQQPESNNLYQLKRTLPTMPNLSLLGAGMPMDSDYESLLEKSLVKEVPSGQESYEEVLYQMAKMIFIQAAEGGGDLGTEQVLREISLILSKEVERGMISQDMQKRIIELIVSALTDTLATPEPNPSFVPNPDYFLQETRGASTPGLSSPEKIPTLLHSPLFNKGDNTQFNSHFLVPFSSLKNKRDTNKA